MSFDPAADRLLKEGWTRDASGQYFASPVAAHHKLFLASTKGKITVLKAGPRWMTLAVNDLDDDIHATPAPSDRMI